MKSLIEKLTEFTSSQLTVQEVALSLIVALVFGLFVFIINRITAKKELYSVNFGIALIAVAVITDSIIVAIQNSLVVSLGMVGALSIVRFRTAVKDPLDLVYLFWSISMGIVTGSGLYYLGVLTSCVLSVVLLVCKNIPMLLQPVILTVTFNDLANSDKVVECIRKHSKHIIKKSQSVKNGSVSCVYEVSVKKEEELLADLNKLSFVTYTGAVEPSNLIS